MVSALDVAQYIIDKKGPMSAMKLQKLVYYSQAWSLTWDEAPLFFEKIEAWANGPIVRELFDVHRGQFIVNSIPRGNPNELNQVQKETIDAIIRDYGNYTAQQLSDLTHMEEPWIEARKGLAPNERGFRVIDHASMHSYYHAL